MTHDNMIRCPLGLSLHLYPFSGLRRTRLVIEKVIGFDADTDDLALVDVHSVGERGVEEVVCGCELGVGKPEVGALVRVAGGLLG